MMSVTDLELDTLGYDPRAAGADCDRCPLRGSTPVPPDPGHGKPRLLIIGEAPGHYESAQGRVFIGPSGKKLDRDLERHGLQRRDTFVTNAMACTPLSDDDKQRATQCCAPRLQQELETVDPEKKLPVLTLGKWPAFALLGVRKIFAHRGFVWKAPTIPQTRVRAAARSREKARAAVSKERTQDRLLHLAAMASYASRTIVPSVHPAFVLRPDGELWAGVQRGDFRRAVKLALGQPLDLLDEGRYEVLTGADQRRLVKALSVLGDTVAVDIESAPSEIDQKAGKKYPDPTTCTILCVGLSDAHPDVPRDRWNTFVLHPRVFGKPHGAVLTRILKDRTAVFHNGAAFDEIALGRYGVRFGKTACTLIAHHAFASHMPQSLGHVASVFADVGPWKANHQAGGALAERGTSPWESGGEELERYNAADVRIDSFVWHTMQPELSRERVVYERDMAVAKLCQEMQLTGLGVDMARRSELSRQLKTRAKDLLHEIRKLVKDPDFDPARSADMRRALFGRFRAPYFKLTPTGYRSTGAEVLETLRGSFSTNYGRLSDLVLRWRSATKSDSTFLSAPLGSDGRVHSSWRAFGTESGRPASRNPNLLNVPRYGAVTCRKCTKLFPETLRRCPQCGGQVREAFDQQIRDIYVARPGYVYVYFDVKQAEAWAAAMQSNDPNFITTCRSGDVHIGNACVIFPEQAEIIRNDPKGAGKPCRDIAKNAGFAVYFGAEWETIYKYLRARGFAVSARDVQLMLDQLRASYRVYYEWCRQNLEFVQQHGYLRTTLLGRIRWLGQTPKPTYVMNTPIQSFVSDVMGERLLEIHTRQPKSAKLVLYVYDAGCWEVRAGRDADQLLQAIKDVWSREIVLPNGGQRWVQPVDCKTGERWSEL